MKSQHGKVILLLRAPAVLLHKLPKVQAHRVWGELVCLAQAGFQPGVAQLAAFIVHGFAEPVRIHHQQTVWGEMDDALINFGVFEQA